MENENLIYKRTRVVSSVFLDSEIKLGIAQIIMMIQDNLTECFGLYNCDGVILKQQGKFWVVHKTRVHFNKRPDWRTKINVETFPVSNSGIRTNMNTVFTDEIGNVLITANQECCVLDNEKHRPVKLSLLPFPKENYPAKQFLYDFEKFEIDESDYQVVYEQKIRSQSIDMSHHLNNTEYIKLALNVFDTSFLEEHKVCDLEAHYLEETQEGQTLVIAFAEKEGIYFIRITESNHLKFEMKICFN